MKRIAIIFSAIALTLLPTACRNNGEVPRLQSQQDTLSWAMGENIAMSLNEMGVLNLNNEIVHQAIAHTLAGKQQPLDDSTFRDAMDYITVTLQTDMMSKNNQRKAQIEQLQEAYFAQLEKEHEGIKKHPMGFYYEVVREGQGPRAKYGEVVTFDYRSYTMLDGEPYDQTYGRRRSIAHVVGKPMFPGLLEGMQLMNAGSLYRFYFPYQVAFGPQGSGDIPGYTPFIYEVEVHKISDR